MSDPRHTPLMLAGSARARGRAAGAARRGAIARHLAAWLGSLGQPSSKKTSAYVAALLANTCYLDACEQFCPDLLDEVRGLAEGANQSFEQIFALQLLDEEWVFRRHGSGLANHDRCSSLALIESPDFTWLAQNMDLGPYTDGHQALLTISEPGRPTTLVFSLHGMLGLMGANSAGVGVCVNSLPQEQLTTTGLPVAFIIRKLLQSHSVDEAVFALLTLPHASCQHYLIAGPGQARSFEAGPEGTAEYHPADRRRLFHTNHRLIAGTGDALPATSLENSEARLATLQARLGGDHAISLAAIESALASRDDSQHPVCRELRPDAGQTGFTTGSMIMALGARTEGWICMGPPVIGQYRRHDVVPDPIRAVDRRPGSFGGDCESP